VHEEKNHFSVKKKVGGGNGVVGGVIRRKRGGVQNATVPTPKKVQDFANGLGIKTKKMLGSIKTSTPKKKETVGPKRKGK